ncbi:hypothetical protein JCM10207_003915 [Rhodosporidiobolus poonsookiae]
MDDSWSWDGSIISLPSTASSTDSPPVRSRNPSTRSLASSTSGGLPAPTEELLPSPELSLLGTTPTAGVAPVHESLPTSQSSSDLPSSFSVVHEPPTPPPAARLSPHPHPLASFLLDKHSLGLSPPTSPSASSVSSFPSLHPRSRAPSGTPDTPIKGRGRGRGRHGSVSSTASTDGSAHEGASLASGVSGSAVSSGGSAGDDDQAHHHGLVMPSIHFSGTSLAPPSSAAEGKKCGSSASSCGGASARFLVLGHTEDERHTLATLVALDDDLQRTASSASVTGATDMSFSFLSTKASERSSSSTRSSENKPLDRIGIFEALLPAASSSNASVVLFHPPQGYDANRDLLSAELSKPLEQLAAKLDDAFPSTTGLKALVEKAGVGKFDGLLFLFSSPPTLAELNFARPLSRLIPLYPVLILPPSPTGKPQKTSALEQAVREQLDTAGVRWVPAVPSREKEPRGMGELYMLPHDLFVHHAPVHPAASSTPASAPSSFAGDSAPVSAGSTQASSPATEDPPTTSLTSSQELPPPPMSPTFTSSSSFGPRSASPASSSRSPSISSRSSSHRRAAHTSQHARYSNSLASLYALQVLVHSAESPARVRAERARQFLEWREVEVAARAGEAAKVTERQLEQWGEEVVSPGGGGAARANVDFSRRVAERRAAIRARDASTAETVHALHRHSVDDDGDVLDDDSDDDERAGASLRYDRGGTARNSFSAFSYGTASSSMDPTTPRVSYRPLPFAGASSSGYFPAPPAPSSTTTSSAPLSDSIPSLGSSSGKESDASGGASDLGASSILVLPAAATDPFHLPSLLHLVGLNLRLAVFSPALASASASTTTSPAPSVAGCSGEKEPRPRKEGKTGWGGWVRAAAVVGLAFAVGVAAGVTVVASVGDQPGGGLGADRWLAAR